jgi:hypothetical protein
VHHPHPASDAMHDIEMDRSLLCVHGRGQGPACCHNSQYLEQVTTLCCNQVLTMLTVATRTLAPISSLHWASSKSPTTELTASVSLEPRHPATLTRPELARRR